MTLHSRQSNSNSQARLAGPPPKLARILVFCAGVALMISGAMPLARRILADSNPSVHLNAGNAAPREVEDNTQQSVLRDYTAAWKGLSTALAHNTLEPLDENFTGFALNKLTARVKQQKQNGLTTRIIDHGHKVDAVFYSPDGSAIELKDTASLETQVLDGGNVIHSDQAQVHYYAVLTGAADRWKVRVLEAAK
ncbi:MAG: hypothetical protein ACM3SW_16695 [Actinomycetota bacterium]